MFDPKTRPQAIAICNAELAKDPKDRFLLQRRGLCYAWSGKPTAAIKDLELAAKVAPQDPESFVHLCNLYRSNNRMRDARTMATKVQTMAPDNGVGWVLAAKNLFAERKFQQALDDLRIAKGKVIDYNTFATEEFVAHTMVGDIRAAEAVWKKATTENLSLDWNEICVHANQAAAEQKYNLCLFMINKHPKRDTDPICAYLRALSLAQTGRIQEAEIAARNLPETGVTSRVARSSLAMAYLNNGKPKQAIKTYNQIKPEHRTYDEWDGLYQAHIKAFDYEGAIDDLTKMLTYSPKATRATIYIRRGDIYALLSNQDAAVADYTAAIKLEPYNRSHYKKRADMYEEMKQFAKARTDLARYDALSISSPR